MDTLITLAALIGAGALPVPILYWHYRTTQTREEPS